MRKKKMESGFHQGGYGQITVFLTFRKVSSMHDPLYMFFAFFQKKSLFFLKKFEARIIKVHH